MFIVTLSDNKHNQIFGQSVKIKCYQFTVYIKNYIAFFVCKSKMNTVFYIFLIPTRNLKMITIKFLIKNLGSL